MGQSSRKNRIKYEKLFGEWIMVNYSGVGTVNLLLNTLKGDTLISKYEGTSNYFYLTKL